MTLTTEQFLGVELEARRTHWLTRLVLRAPVRRRPPIHCNGRARVINVAFSPVARASCATSGRIILSGKKPPFDVEASVSPLPVDRSPKLPRKPDLPGWGWSSHVASQVPFVQATMRLFLPRARIRGHCIPCASCPRLRMRDTALEHSQLKALHPPCGFIPFHSIPFNSISFHFIALQIISFHFRDLRPPTPLKHPRNSFSCCRVGHAMRGTDRAWALDSFVADGSAHVVAGSAPGKPSQKCTQTLATRGNSPKARVHLYVLHVGCAEANISKLCVLLTSGKHFHDEMKLSRKKKR